MTIRMKFKLDFFDHDKVIKAVGRANVKILNEVGRKIRATAQKSLVYAEGPSSPGSPPHAHKSRKKTRTSKKTGKTRTRSVSFLREFLYYSYDFSSRSVVIGPEKLNSTVDSSALHALEEGGTSKIPAGPGGKTRTVKIRKRPYVKPAMEKNLPDFRQMWKNSVRSTP